MKKLVLNVVSQIHHDQLMEAFTAQDILVIKREDKEQSNKELIFYSTPEMYLASFGGEGSSLAFNESLSEWREKTKQQLSLALSNPDDTFVISLDDLYNDQETFIRYLKESLGLEVDVLCLPKLDKTLLAENIIQIIEDDVSQEIYGDLRAASDYFDETQDIASTTRLKTYIIDIKKEMKGASGPVALQEKLTQQHSKNIKLQEDRNALESEMELALLQIAQLQEELETSFISSSELESSEKLKQEMQQLLSEKEKILAKKALLKEDRKTLESEHELALLQIAQLQEELEFYFMKSESNDVSDIYDATLTDLSKLKNSFYLKNILKGKRVAH